MTTDAGLFADVDLESMFGEALACGIKDCQAEAEFAIRWKPSTCSHEERGVICAEHEAWVRPYFYSFTFWRCMQCGHVSPPGDIVTWRI